MTNPRVGFGLCPFGTSPYGYGTPATEDPRGGAVFRDPTTGQQQNARLIDGTTKKHVYDVNGRALGVSGVRHRVQLALSTDKGTSAIVSLGQDLKSIKRITSDLQRRVRDTITQALAHMTSGGTNEVEILSIDARHVRNGLIAVVVKWRDLTSPARREFEEKVGT